MNDVPTSYKVAGALIALYGLASIVGGMIGYFKAGSKASLIAGVPAGVILIACAVGAFQRAPWSMIGAIIVAVLIGGFFGSKLVSNLGTLGEFVSSSAGPRTLAMSIGALVVIVASVVALTNRPPMTP